MAKEKKISDVNASDAKVDKIGSKPIKVSLFIITTYLGQLFLE